MHWRLPTEHVASGPFSSDERLKPAPVGSATAAIRPYGVSSAPRTTEPLTPAEVAQLYWDPRELIGFTERSTTTLTTLQSKLERTRAVGFTTAEPEWR
jgi:DNA-binding IclR family transcriptional regulator